MRNDHLLLLVVRSWDTLEELDSLDGGLSSGKLVGKHTTDGTEEDAARCALVEGTKLLWVDQMALV